MTEQVRDNYELKSNELRTVEIPYARLIDTTPTASNPAAVNGLDYANGEGLTGVIISVDASDSVAVLDVGAGNQYYFEVRNVLTYAGAEATWGAINIGDPVYYDDTAGMPAGVYLSTSPLDTGGNANVKFGHVVPWDDADLALYPKGGITASTQECGVVIIGAGVA
ncbi:MAG: hypothetical protein ABII76_14165 [Pseudomonadota bacterium]